jgi:hypothetical protein
MSLQIHYKWTDGTAARGAMLLGAYHSLPAPVRIIPLAQIRAPVDINSLIHNKHLKEGRSQEICPLRILQKQEDDGIMKGNDFMSACVK